MRREAIETLGSSIIIFVTGYIIWPPSVNSWWWEILPGSSDFIVLAALLAICVPVGIGISALIGIRLSHLTLGGFLAYLTGMMLIDSMIQPDSPAHYIGYGSILLFIFLGAAVWNAVAFIWSQSAS